jgi:hypothetical protein
MDPRWRRLLLLHRWAFGLWLGWLPFGAVVMVLQGRYLPPPVAIILALIYLGAFAATGWTLSFSACPNCGQTFLFDSNRRLRWQSPFALPRCYHCNAQIGDPIAQSDVHVP